MGTQQSAAKKEQDVFDILEISEQQQWDKLVEETLKKEQDHKERKRKKEEMLLERMSEGNLPDFVQEQCKSMTLLTDRSTATTQSQTTTKSDEPKLEPLHGIEENIIVSNKHILEKPRQQSSTVSFSSSRTTGSHLKISFNADQMAADEEEDL